MPERKNEPNRENQPKRDQGTGTPPQGDTLSEQDQSRRQGSTRDVSERQNTNQETGESGQNEDIETGRTGNRSSEESI